MGAIPAPIVFLIVASSIIGYLVLLEFGRRPAEPAAPPATVPAQQ